MVIWIIINVAVIIIISSTILIACHLQDATYKEEVKFFHQLEAQINRILAKHSPVVIVQRCLRGYFARKR